MNSCDAKLGNLNLRQYISASQCDENSPQILFFILMGKNIVMFCLSRLMYPINNVRNY